MNLRFKLGEMALLAHPEAPKLIVEVVAVGPFKKDVWVLGLVVLSDCDYVIDVPKYFFPSTAICNDHHLIKLEDPDATETIEEDAEVHA